MFKVCVLPINMERKANQPLPKSMLDGVPAWANHSCSLQKFYFRHSFDFVLGLGAIFFSNNVF